MKKQLSYVPVDTLLNVFFFNVSNLPAGSDPVGLVLELVGPQLEEMLENQE